MTVLLSTRGLKKSFGGLRAVDGVDFALETGEIRAIIGPNGAGKTTFVSLVCGRILPDAGTIVFDGGDITALPAHARVRLGIAYTFQITSIYPRLGVFDNVALAAQRAGGGGLRERAMAALERVHLERRHAEPAGTLPYGHQRLLELAMALALKPRLLILDEPTQGLSDAEIADFITLVRVLSRDATILLIEHNMPVVMELAGRITVMESGKVLAEGTPAEISADPAVQRAYLGAPADG
ncbi:MAG: ABC transporter ATP-binding protein [Rhizobiaceae bacterium]|jgi:branched-chain amino acid transport system ATP-binding protein